MKMASIDPKYKVAKATRLPRSRAFNSLQIVLDDKIYVDDFSGNFIILVKHHPTVKSLMRRQPLGALPLSLLGVERKCILIGNTYIADLEKRATAALMRGGQRLADGWELQPKPPRQMRTPEEAIDRART
jgi:hypothetical protein